MAKNVSKLDSPDSYYPPFGLGTDKVEMDNYSTGGVGLNLDSPQYNQGSLQPQLGKVTINMDQRFPARKGELDLNEDNKLTVESPAYDNYAKQIDADKSKRNID